MLQPLNILARTDCSLQVVARKYNKLKLYLAASLYYLCLNNRQRDEIVRDILSAAIDSREGLPISHIMFKVGLTHGQAKIYVAELMEKGLMDNRMSRKFYHTTPKGMEYLATINSMTEMLKPSSVFAKG